MIEGGLSGARGVLSVLAVAAFLWVLWPDGSQHEPSGRLPPAISEPPVGLDGVVAGNRRPLPPRGVDVAGGGSALRDTAVDGSLPVDADGHLIAAPDLIRFFDYFFLDSGAVDDAVIRRRIEAAIDARLDEPARGEARRLLESYLEYRAAAARLFAAGGGEESLAGRIAAIDELRRAAFGDDADSLFGSDLEHARVAAEIRAAAADPALSEEQRAARIEEMEARLPDDVRAAREQAVAPLVLARDEARLRDSGAGDEEIRALREERFGSAAADRLAALDRDRVEWRGRVDEFRRQRSAIEADDALRPEQRAARVEDLLQESFSETERRRILALDRIELGR